MGPDPAGTDPTGTDPTGIPRSAATRPPSWRLVAGCAVVAAWITVDVLVGGPWTHLDHRVSRLIHPWHLYRGPWPRYAVYTFAEFGGRIPILVALGLFTAGLSVLRRTWQPVLRMVVAVGLLTAFVYAFKIGVGRTAPVIDRIHAHGASYPSGHVPNAIVLWGVAAWLAVDYDIAGRLRRLLGALRVVAPVCAGLGMLLLDFHWLSDLVAGVAFGVLLLRVLHLIFDGGRERWGDARPVADPPAVDVAARRGGSPRIDRSRVGR